jgi:hypothetical protein
MKSKKTKKETPRKSAAKAKPPRAKVEELTQTNGKSYEEDPEVQRVRKLEKILEVSKTNPYGTNDRRVFEEDISAMNLTDLQSLAVRIGVFPSGNQTSLKNKLIKAFKSENHGRSDLIAPRTPAVVLDPKNPKHKEVLDYLNG